jgi:hypothetical protein
MFFLRVKAVYFDSKITIVFFGLLWLAVTVTIPMALFRVFTIHIGTTKTCMLFHVKYYGAIPLLLHSSFDALVFIAISFRLASYSMTANMSRGHVTSIFRGHGLPHLSKILVQGGQLYYWSVDFDCH